MSLMCCSSCWLAETTKASHMFDIFIRHTWMPCTFVAKTHNHIMDGGTMWYSAQKWLWTCTFNFILINYSTHTHARTHTLCLLLPVHGKWADDSHIHIYTQCSQKQSALPSSRYSVNIWEFISQMVHKQHVYVFY